MLTLIRVAGGRTRRRARSRRRRPPPKRSRHTPPRLFFHCTATHPHGSLPRPFAAACDSDTPSSRRLGGADWPHLRRALVAACQEHARLACRTRRRTPGAAGDPPAPLVLAAPSRPATNRCGRAPRPALGGGCIRGPTKAEAGPGYRHRAERRGMRRGTCRASGPTITSARTARRCDSRPATGLRPEGPVQAAEAAPGACGAVYRGAASESRRASVSQ